MERQLQLKTQQQFTKEYMEAKGLKEEQEAGQSQGPGPGLSPAGPLPCAGAQVHTSSDTDEEANRDGEQDEQPGEEGEEVKPSVILFVGLLIIMMLILTPKAVYLHERLLYCFRKRTKTTKMRAQRTKRTEKKTITPSFHRWAQSSTGMGLSHHSSLLCPPRRRPSPSPPLCLCRPPSSPSSRYRTTTLRTTREAPAQSCRGYWWGSRCWASSNRVNSWEG